MLTIGKPPLRMLASLIALGAVVSAVSGCALVEGPTPKTPVRETPAAPDAPPQLIPGGSAADNLPYFTEVLRGYAGGDEPIIGAPIVNTIADSGFDRAAMQVSFDQSKTGLAADNIFVSVRVENQCLIGQVVAADRSFVASVQPAVGPGQDICLIGETCPIDW